IKQFVFIDLTCGCAVGAAHVISKDLQARHGVGLSVIVQQKIAHLLICVGEVGMRFDPDQATEDTTGASIKRILVKEIAGGVGRDMILESTSVEFLVLISD